MIRRWLFEHALVRVINESDMPIKMRTMGIKCEQNKERVKGDEFRRLFSIYTKKHAFQMETCVTLYLI